MVLTKDRTSEFYGKDYEIKIILDGDFNKFNDYREVFDFFTRFDSIYNDYKYADSEYNQKTERTQVVSIKQGSLEIGAFIEEHWFELLVLFLASYKDAKLNISEAFQDLDNLIENGEKIVKEVVRDFPEFEIEQITEIVSWYKSLALNEKARFLFLIKRNKKTLQRIKQIIVKRQ
jgi:hypothetical protein